MDEESRLSRVVAFLMGAAFFSFGVWSSIGMEVEGSDWFLIVPMVYYGGYLIWKAITQKRVYFWKTKNKERRGQWDFSRLEQRQEEQNDELKKQNDEKDK